MQEKQPREIGKYRIIKKIGEGSFGKVYRAYNKNDKKYYALKIETSRDKNFYQIKNEFQIYKALKNCEGVANCYDFCSYGGTYYLVMDLYDKSLQDLFENNNKKFSIDTVCKLAVKLIDIFEDIHCSNIILRDFKPDNVMIKGDKVCMVDFGMAKYYIDNVTNEHIPFVTNKKLSGTLRYASLNTHYGYEHSRRDDLETLLYSLIFFIKGTLPWIGIKANSIEEKFNKIAKKKENITPEELCSDIPKKKNFIEALKYVKNLQFAEDPNYNRLRGYFQEIVNEINKKSKRKVNKDEIIWELKDEELGIDLNDTERRSPIRRFFSSFSSCFD